MVASGSASEDRTVKCLRVRMKPKRPTTSSEGNRRNNGVSNSGGSNYGAGRVLAGSPLDRFCVHMLQSSVLSSIYDSVAASEPKPKVRCVEDSDEKGVKLAERFSSHEEYLAAYEGIVIEEIRANIVGSASQRFTGAASPATGTVQVSEVDSTVQPSTRLVKLNCALDGTFSTTSSRDSRTGAAYMDLLLLGSKKVSSISDLSPDGLRSGDFMLAVVVSVHKGIQIKVVTEGWLGIKAKLTSAARSATRETNKRGREKMQNILSSTKPTASDSKVQGMGVGVGTGSGLGKRPAAGARGLPSHAADDSKSIMIVGSQKVFRLHCLHLDGMLSPWREFMAIHELKQSPLLHSVLSPPLDAAVPGTPPQNFMQRGITDACKVALCSKLNKAQQQAVQVAASQDGFVLVQGPPGTGKTSTIVGILNTVHQVLGPEGLITRLNKQKPHILVCAPSNVAVDNIIERIMERGFNDGTGKVYRPNMLRLGSGKGAKEQLGALDDAMRAETLRGVERQIQEFVKQLQVGWEVRVDQATTQPYWVNHNLQSTEVAKPNHSDYLLSDYTLETLPEYIAFSGTLLQQIDQLDRLNLFAVRCRARVDVIETSIIDEAHLVFTTLNGAGHPSLEGTSFEVTVIDEAGQCVEPSALIALRRGCKRCVMVGDPCQLPATIFSDKAKKVGYDRSLFERLMKIGHSSILLDTQYRMAPAISEFSSRTFYGSNLKDGSIVCNHSYLPSYLRRPGSEVSRGPVLRPLMFFDVASSESKGGVSRSNISEVQVCVKLVRFLISEAQRCSESSVGSIGIITPYAEQLSALRRAFRENDQGSLSSSAPDLELNTVDGFQGREKDIIVISCVRANDEGSIGFLSDRRRMNVALTRAKHGMFVIGNAETLQGNELWSRFIKHTDESQLRYPIRAEGDFPSQLVAYGAGQSQSR
eukprot:GSChrysophyteH1.ASY1.ANO1.685.1 assembled CDS